MLRVPMMLAVGRGQREGGGLGGSEAQRFVNQEWPKVLSYNVLHPAAVQGAVGSGTPQCTATLLRSSRQRRKDVFVLQEWPGRNKTNV